MILNLNEKEYFASGHNACPGCGAALCMRLITKAAGDNTIVIQSTGCMEVVSTPYPSTSWRLPYIHVAFENAAAVGSGVEVALRRLDKDTNVLIVGGDGGTFDIGLQALSGAIERGHNFCYVCYDNEAYMNTGIQRSGATPRFANTTTTPIGKEIRGKVEWKKPMPFIMAANGAKYVATASMAYPQDLVRKVKKGLAIGGPAYVQVFCTCPVGWRSKSEKTIEIAKLAVETKVFPLFEIENGKLTLTKKIEKPKPVKNYLALQGRFKHLKEEEIKEIEKHINDNYNYIVGLDKTKAKI